MDIGRDGGATAPLDPPVVLTSSDFGGVFGASPTVPLLTFVEERRRGNIWLLEAMKGRF